MPSVILYDGRNNEIKRCQVQPFGSAPPPTLESLCRSARIADDDKQHMLTCQIEDMMLTADAQKDLRIVDGEIFLKPKVNISTDKAIIDLAINPTFTISVTLTDLLETDSFIAVVLCIKDAPITIPIIDDVGHQEIELSEPGMYSISCQDERLRANQIEIEGV